jgi:hypothetical protein
VEQAIAGPFLVAALTLCVAGVAKLRAPATAAAALIPLGLPAQRSLIRAFALCELALGAVAAVHPTPALAGAVAALYAGFAVLAVALARRGAACGCFGESNAPASLGQAAISGALALVAAAAATNGALGATWILGRSPMVALSLILGLAAAVGATVVALSELPAAWNAWSGR